MTVAKARRAVLIYAGAFVMSLVAVDVFGHFTGILDAWGAAAFFAALIYWPLSRGTFWWRGFERQGGEPCGSCREVSEE